MTEVDPEPGTGKKNRRRLPDDVSTNSPWGWWIGNLFARYKNTNGVTNGDATHNGPNPTGNPFGNAVGAFVNAIEFVNEPNYLCWSNTAQRNASNQWIVDPQSGENLMVCRIAQMFQTAEYYSYGYAGPAVIGPATHDTAASYLQPDVFDYLRFTQQVLNALANWRPRVYVGWSFHSYREVKVNDPAMTLTKNQINSLYSGAWKGPSADRFVWITESGYNIGTPTPSVTQETTQRDLVVANYGRLLNISEVYLTTTHSLHDVVGGLFCSGLFNPGLNPTLPNSIIGHERLLYAWWQALSANTTP